MVLGFSMPFLMELFCAISLIWALLYMYMKFKLYTFWEEKGVLYIEPSVPFGNIAHCVMGKLSLGEIYEKAYAEYKKNRYFGMFTFYKPSLVINDPELIRIVLTKNFKNFHDRGMYCNEEIDPLSGHLFLLSGAKWKNLRAKLAPTFTSGKMKLMFKTVHECANKMTKHLKEIADRQGIVEMKDFTARVGIDVIASTAFGIESNCLDNPDSEFRFWARKAFEPKPLKNSMFMFAPQIMDFLQIVYTDKGVAEFFTKTFKDTVEYRNVNNVTRPDFMNLLMQLMDRGYVDGDDGKIPYISESNGENITMNEALAQAFVFFLAGFESSSSVVTHCLFELSRECNQEIQERTVEDIDAVLQKYDGEITYECTQDMTYLHKVISETMRKYPPLPILNRVCTKGIKLPGTDLAISESTDVVIPVLGIHRDPNFYPDPLKFDPDRFNEDNSTERHPYVYLPFGLGPRDCIGTRFGLLQMKIILIKLLSTYKFTLGPDTRDPLEWSAGAVFMTSKHGINLKIEHR